MEHKQLLSSDVTCVSASREVLVQPDSVRPVQRKWGQAEKLAPNLSVAG